MEQSFSLRNTSPNDYDSLCEWWKSYNFPVIPLEFLPNNGNDGVMVSFDGIDTCAGFLYATSSPVLFWCEWIVSNPNVRGQEIRKQALTLLINAIVTLSIEMGAKAIFTSVKNKNLIEYFKECGFTYDGTSSTEMIKII